VELVERDSGLSYGGVMLVYVDGGVVWRKMILKGSGKGGGGVDECS